MNERQQSKADSQVVANLIENGPIGTRPDWTKPTILEDCHRLYRELEAVRRWILRHKLAQLESKE